MPAGLLNTVAGVLAAEPSPAKAVPRPTALSSFNWNAAARAELAEAAAPSKAAEASRVSRKGFQFGKATSPPKHPALVGRDGFQAAVTVRWASEVNR